MAKRKLPTGIRPLDEPGAFQIRATIRDPITGKRHHIRKTLRGATLQEARAERKRLIEKVCSGHASSGASPGRSTLGTWARCWIENRKAEGEKFSTRRGKILAMRDHILPTFGSWYVDGIRRSDVREWIAKMHTKRKPKSGEPYSPAGIDNWLRILQACVSAYYLEHELGPSPLVRLHVRIPPRSRDNPNSLTLEELAKFLPKALELYPQHYAMILVGFCTGMRWGELSALRWCNVDLQAGLLVVCEAQWRGRLGTTKTDAVRELGMAPEMIEVLQEHRHALVREQHPGLASGLVFPSDAGRYRFESLFTTPFARILKACGIGKHLTPHGMRRTFNNLLRQQSVDRQVLRSLTGHSSETMTGLYSTVEVEEKKAAVTNLVQRLAETTKADT